MRYLFDAYAWIAYMEGGVEGQKVHNILSEEHDIFSLPITITEVVSKVKKKGGNVEVAYDAIISNSKIMPITPKMAKEAGLFYVKEREKQPSFGMANSLIYIASKFLDSKILTGDGHFKKFKNVKLI